MEKNPQEVSIATATQLQGKALSYNNIADTDAALETVKLFSEPSCVIVKHANPCGVATAETIQQAYLRAFTALILNQPLAVLLLSTVRWMKTLRLIFVNDNSLK